MQELPGFPLQSLNKLLAGVRKTLFLWHLNSEISQEHSGNSLISLQHLERRLHIDLFGLLCFVECDKFYIQGKGYLRIMKTFHIANSHTHPDKKLNPCPQFVQLNTKGKRRNVVITAVLLPVHHRKYVSWLRAGVICNIVIYLKRYTQVKADRKSDWASLCWFFYTISIALPWGVSHLFVNTTYSSLKMHGCKNGKCTVLCWCFSIN